MVGWWSVGGCAALTHPTKNTSPHPGDDGMVDALRLPTLQKNTYLHPGDDGMVGALRLLTLQKNTYLHPGDDGMVGALRLPTLQKTPLLTLAMTAWWVRFAYPPYKKHLSLPW
ncbi:hypothetical protein ACT47F_003096 [Cronobacter malonaticus]